MQKEKVLDILNRWKDRLEYYNLPSWEDMPDLELYMDQVVILVNKYLSIIAREGDSERAVTPAMINNYVKLKIIPAPINKKYSRIHIAYLIMVCTLKQTMNISSVRKMMPLEISADEAREMYERFVIIHKKVSTEYTGQLSVLAEPIYNDTETDMAVQAFVLETAIQANLSKLITETVLEANEETSEEESQ